LQEQRQPQTPKPDRPRPPQWWIDAVKQDIGRGISLDPRDHDDDTELEIQFALDSIPQDSRTDYDEWVLIGGMVACALGDSGFDIWDEFSQRSAKYDAAFTEKKWAECLKFTAYGTDGASIFRIANRYGRSWKAAYLAEYAKLIRARCT
jgi:hypothetical protein